MGGGPGGAARAEKTHKLGIVTNCSERRGRAAAKRVGVPFDVLVTSERAGFYKPHPAPYRLALSELELKPAEVPFIALGLDTYWHSRIGLRRPAGAPPPLRESRSLADLVMM